MTRTPEPELLRLRIRNHALRALDAACPVCGRLFKRNKSDGYACSGTCREAGKR